MRDTIRIYVTEKCNANCSNCFNMKSRTNNEIKVETFNKLCLYLKQNGITKVKLLGGEPTMHPAFEDIIKISQQNFKHVGIFTNGLKNRFSNIKLRDTDSIIYNMNFFNNFDKDVFQFDQKGSRVLEIQILKNTKPLEIIEMMRRFSNIELKRLTCNLTLDCKANIFLEKSQIIPKLLFLEKQFKKLNINFFYDHKLPFCYLYKSGLTVLQSGICSLFSSGVIDANLNLRFCLQNTEVLLSLLSHGNFIPWKIIENNLEKKYIQLRYESLKKICCSCIFYNTKCNGGCWIPQEFVKKEDILNNTEFPLVKKENSKSLL